MPRSTPYQREPGRPADIPPHVADRIAMLPKAADRAKALHTYRLIHDPVYAMKERARSLVSGAITRRGYRKTSPTARLLGCTWPEFARHIELQFLPGMSWENRYLWHVDHIVAMASAATEADAAALNHFTNLRPLWSVDNLMKGARRLYLL